VSLRLDYPNLPLLTWKLPPEVWLSNVLRDHLPTKPVGLLVGSPKASIDKDDLDYVLLDYALNSTHDTDTRRNLVETSLKSVKPGGLVVSLSYACNCSQELLMSLELAGVNIYPFVNNILTNKQIIQLKPTIGEWIKYHRTFNTRTRGVLLQFVQALFPDVTEEQIAHIPHNFAFNLLYAGLIWKPQKP